MVTFPIPGRRRYIRKGEKTSRRRREDSRHIARMRFQNALYDGVIEAVRLVVRLGGRFDAILLRKCIIE